MLGTMAARNAKAVAMFIHRHGVISPIYRRTQTGTDRLNNPDYSWSVVGETLVMRHYQRGADEYRNYESGYREYETPSLIFPADSAIEDKDRVVVDEEYTVTSVDSRGAYLDANGKAVKENRVSQ